MLTTGINNQLTNQVLQKYSTVKDINKKIDLRVRSHFPTNILDKFPL